MTYGGSLFLIAVGAILRYAVSTTVSGISLTTVGLILMLIGIVAFVLSLIYMFGLRRGPIAGAPVAGARYVERPVAAEPVVERPVAAEPVVERPLAAGRVVERESYYQPPVRSY